jgi:hypothetical protein
VGLHAVCVAPYLRLPSGCVRWVAVAVVVVAGRALPSFLPARWLQDPPALEPVLEVRAARERVFERLLAPSALVVHYCAVLRGRGAVGPVTLPFRWLKWKEFKVWLAPSVCECVRVLFSICMCASVL